MAIFTVRGVHNEYGDSIWTLVMVANEATARDVVRGKWSRGYDLYEVREATAEEAALWNTDMSDRQLDDALRDIFLKGLGA